MVKTRELGKACKLAKKFTNEIEKFHEDIALTNSIEEMYLVLNKVKFPIEVWRDFLEEYTYFDDQELMSKWIAIEKKFFQNKRAFEDGQRVLMINLDAHQNMITILAYFNDFENADIKWIAANALLSRIVDQNIQEKWKLFEQEYLKWKENYNLGKKVYYIKISEDLRKVIEELTKESLEFLNQAKLTQSFEKQNKIVELIESFFK